MDPYRGPGRGGPPGCADQLAGFAGSPSRASEEVIRAQASASVDRVFVAVCDRVGPEQGTHWVGGSAIMGPDGYPLAGSEAGGGPQTLLARCALAQARNRSSSAVNNVVADVVRSSTVALPLSQARDRRVPSAEGSLAGQCLADHQGVHLGSALVGQD